MLKRIRKWFSGMFTKRDGRRPDLNLSLFGEGGGGDGAAAAGGGEGASAETSTGAPIQEGILPDGTRMDRRLAERMERQRKRNPELKIPEVKPAQQEEPTQTEPTQENPEQEWDSLKKGKYAEQYGRDVKAAVDARFRNQADLQAQLNGLKPMLDALAKQRGINAGDYNALSKAILDDDSLYEDEAEAHGMTVEAYKSYRALEAEAEGARQQRAQAQQNAFFSQHLQKLVRQAEELKTAFPDFDLQRELNTNEDFRRLTSPEVGLSVENAYYAVHHRELAPRAAQAGVQYAQRQIAQSLQANAKRPTEGAMQGNTAAAKIGIDVKNMSKAEWQRLKEDMRRRSARGEKITLD